MIRNLLLLAVVWGGIRVLRSLLWGGIVPPEVHEKRWIYGVVVGVAAMVLLTSMQESPVTAGGVGTLAAYGVASGFAAPRQKIQQPDQSDEAKGP